MVEEKTLLDLIKDTVEEGKKRLEEIDKALKVMEEAGEVVTTERRAFIDVKGRIERLERGLTRVK